ncbi:MAG: hypothetical protein ACE5HQ_05840 [Gemmatimonadota bacterium]
MRERMTWESRCRNRTSVRRLRALVVAAVLGSPVAGLGQVPAYDSEPEPFEPSRIDLVVFGGALTPLSDLTKDENSFGTVITAAASLGAEGTYWFENGFGVAVQALYAPADLRITPTSFQGAVPPDLGSADYIAAAASLRYRLRLEGVAEIVQPYFGLGAGIRHLSVDAIASPEVDDVTDPVATAAAGAFVTVSRLFKFRFELRDWVSSFDTPTNGDSRIQNDISVTIGVGVKLR